MDFSSRKTRPFTPLQNLSMMPSRISNRVSQLVNSIPETLGFQNNTIGTPTKIPSVSIPRENSVIASLKSMPSKIASTIENIEPPTSTTTTSVIETGSGLMSYITPKNILIVVLILIILGFNVVRYLEDITLYLSKLGLNIFKGSSEITRKTIEKTTEGTKVAVDIAGGTLSGGLKQIERTVEQKKDLKPQKRILPDTSGSSVQLPKRKGFCYIGSQDGNRTCLETNVNDTCMSGEIFPTMDVCINPSLRA